MTYEEMFPCRAQIIRTREGRDAAPLDDYSYPENTGEFIGTLAFRCWHRNKPMLLCYFDTDDGLKLKLPVWWQSWGVNYSPAESYINFADEVYDGSRWYCTYRKKQNGYISWCCAESIESNLEGYYKWKGIIKEERANNPKVIELRKE